MSAIEQRAVVRRVVLNNMHFGLLCPWEYPQGYVDLADEEMWEDPSRPWLTDPTLADVSVLLSERSLRKELGDVVFAQGFVALSVRSTPRRFLDYPTVEVQFVPYPGVPNTLLAKHVDDDARTDRYWLGAPPESSIVRLVGRDGRVMDGATANRLQMSRGVSALKFSVEADVLDGHVRWVPPASLDLLVVSEELWSHWAQLKVTGVLDAILVPENKFLVRGSRKNVGVPSGTVADPYD